MSSSPSWRETNLSAGEGHRHSRHNTSSSAYGRRTSDTAAGDPHDSRRCTQSGPSGFIEQRTMGPVIQRHQRSASHHWDNDTQRHQFPTRPPNFFDRHRCAYGHTFSFLLNHMCSFSFCLIYVINHKFSLVCATTCT